MTFEEFPKIARLSRECVITEKIDGTNAQIHIVAEDDFLKMPISQGGAVGPKSRDGRIVWLLAGSRSQYISPLKDNHGFARWAWEHADELLALGEGRHYGEWWGSGIQRGYGLQKGEKRFSLFNVARWADERDLEKFPSPRPACCGVVPVIYRGDFHTSAADFALQNLRELGSKASPGFMQPEGIVVWHEAARLMFKKTLERDSEPKALRGDREARSLDVGCVESE